MGVAYKCDRCRILTDTVKQQPFITQPFKTSNEFKQFGFWGDNEDLDYQPHHSVARIAVSNQGDYNEEGELQNADYCIECWKEVMLCMVDYLEELLECAAEIPEGRKDDASYQEHDGESAG